MERKPNYPIHPLLLNRWSPRAMSGETMSDEELFPLFEAARWAPSSFNDQPWTILYAKRETPEWDLFYDLLVEFNRLWCKNAAALVVMVTRTTFEIEKMKGKPSPSHSYSTGAAWMSIALEGSARGYVVHGMSGFDYDKARTTLLIPEGHKVEAMAAIGKPGSLDMIPEQMHKQEHPSQRKELKEILRMGKFR
jgi:nitroreductase